MSIEIAPGSRPTPKYSERLRLEPGLLRPSRGVIWPVVPANRPRTGLDSPLTVDDCALVQVTADMTEGITIMVRRSIGKGTPVRFTSIVVNSGSPEQLREFSERLELMHSTAKTGLGPETQRKVDAAREQLERILAQQHKVANLVLGTEPQLDI